MATVSLLANKAFKYQIILRDNTTTPIKPEPYSFNTSISSQYDNLKFKRLLIDSGTAIHSTNGIGQFEALEIIDNLIKLDRYITRSTSFIFRIGSTLSISTVNLDIPIGLIVFYIVQADTPFILCFADIDKLGVFFNNIINKLVQLDRSHSVIC